MSACAKSRIARGEAVRTGKAGIERAALPERSEGRVSDR
jgi:hypothetical protein